MGLTDELNQRLASLQRRLSDLDEQRSKIEEELGLVQRLLVHSSSGQINIILPALRVSGKPNWAQIARDNDIENWTPQGRRGDSAHRATRRWNPQLHDSIPHYCVHDSRSFP